MIETHTHMVPPPSPPSLLLAVILIATTATGFRGDAPSPTTHPTELKITNDRTFSVRVNWAKQRYLEEQQGTLFPGESMLLKTWEDHVFILRDVGPNGLLVRTVVANRAPTEVYVSGKEFANTFTGVGDVRRLDEDEVVLNVTGGGGGGGAGVPSSSTTPSIQGWEERNAKRVYPDAAKRPVIFYNDYEHPVVVKWEDHQGKEVHQHRLEHSWDQTLYTFVGHVFVMRNESNGVEISRQMIKPDTRYVFVNNVRATTRFHREYERRMGRPWLTVHPRPPITHFMYPMMEVGESVPVETSAPQYHGDLGDIAGDKERASFTLQVKMLSQDPRVYMLENFLSPEECKFIIDTVNGTARLKRSTVTDQAVVLKTRTSSNSWLSWNESPVLKQVYRRGFAAVQIPFDAATADAKAESLQVLRYEHGQEYTRHQDWFPPFDPAYLHDPIVQRGYNRFATLFLYLNDVEEGGETVFPRHGGQSLSEACEKGFGVKPTRGTAVLFYSMLEDGNVDINSLHASCPVKNGTKFGANWWFWEAKRQ